MTLPYAGPAMDGWPSVVVARDGIVVGGRRLEWNDLDPNICRADGDSAQQYLEMRTQDGEEVRIYCPDLAEQERLQHTIVLRQAGLSRDDIPDNGEHVRLLDEDGQDTGIVGVVVGYHLGWVYVDAPYDGVGGRPLREVRRLLPPAR